MRDACPCLSIATDRQSDGAGKNFSRIEQTRPGAFHAARRKVEVERLARASLRRHLALLDPRLSAWDQRV